MRSLFVALFAVVLAVMGACTQSDDVATIEAARRGVVKTGSR